MRTAANLSVLIAGLALVGLLAVSLREQASTSVNDVPSCGLTDDFNDFLESNGNGNDKAGYSNYTFNRTDLPCASYGGRQNSSQVLKKVPIIFIHDNCDLAYGRGTDDGFKSWQTGFRQLASYLAISNYTSAELYTTTYGNADDSGANSNYHMKEWVLRLRKFVEAVLAYTGAKQVNIIAHGMGVTLARKVVKGGTGYDHLAGYYDLGASIKQYVNVFVGIAGYNQGLISCSPGPILPFCSNKDGFFPGTVVGTGLSEYLTDLNLHGGAEGTNVWSIWSTNDEKAGPGSLVFNKITCRIPGQNGQVKKSTSEWTHYYLRDHAGPDVVPLFN